MRNKLGAAGHRRHEMVGANYYQDRLAKNRHLQLAIYAEMLRQETGAWPQVSYFILEASRLLAPDKAFFPEPGRFNPAQRDSHRCFGTSS